MLKYFIGLLLTIAVFAQYPEKGTCPAAVPILDGFNTNAYLGLWYELERYEQIFELNGDCVTAEYSLKDDGSVQVVNSLINLKTGDKSQAVGRAILSSPDATPLPGALNVTFGGEPSMSNYKIIDTDYVTYSLVWNCLQLPNDNKLEGLWVLSRTSTLSPYPETLKQLLEEYGKPEKLRKTEQGER